MNPPPPESPPTPYIPPGWTALPAEPLPRPTVSPAGLALGITFVFWGLISSWVILGLGVGLFIVSLAAWITDLRYERPHHP